MQAAQLIRDEERNWWSVQVFDEESGRYYWMDVKYDPQYKELEIDWNQYIFYLTDEDDVARKEFQENCDNYEAAVEAVYDCLLEANEIAETDDGYELLVEKWKEKTFEIRRF